MLKIGSHISFKSPDYLIGSLKTSIENGANTLMIYLGPPQSTKRVEIERYKIEEYKNEYEKIIKPKDIIIHAPYIINLANKNKCKFAKDFLIEEIKRMNKIGAKYLVLHPGASLDQDRNFSLDLLARNLKEIINQTNDVVITLETMSGKGSELGTSLEELKKLVDLIDEERIGICLDTCHMWDFGYDLKTDFELNDGKSLFDLLNKLDLMKLIKVIHLNDSKNELSSHKDRHENIGKGFIGLKALKNFATHRNFDNIPVILETPFIKEDIYKKEIEMIKG